MKLDAYLEDSADAVVDAAWDAMRRSHLGHYETEGTEAGRRRLRELYTIAVGCVASRNAAPMVAHADRVAEERFAAGYDLFEVQAAFNALEEAMWRRIIGELEPDELATAIGLVSTVLGLGKDKLARTYVSLASRRRAPSLDLKALFQGADGGPGARVGVIRGVIVDADPRVRTV